MAQERVKGFTVTMYPPPDMCSISIGGYEVQIDPPGSGVEVPKNMIEEMKAHGLMTEPPEDDEDIPTAVEGTGPSGEAATPPPASRVPASRRPKARLRRKG